MGFLKLYKQYKIAYKNPFHVAFDRVRNKQHIKIIAKNGKSSYWNGDKVDLYALAVNNNLASNDIDFFTFENSQIPHCINFKYKYAQFMVCNIDQSSNFFGIFFGDEYKFLEPENENVIDIGTNIGDSSIYFTLNKARKVIALDKPFYEIASKNIKTNDLEDRITLLNNSYGNDITLKDIINKYKFDTAVLKMDSSDGEKALLNEEENTLKTFKRMQILCHNDYNELKNKLENYGFTVTVEKEKVYGKNIKSNLYLYAKK